MRVGESDRVLSIADRFDRVFVALRFKNQNINMVGMSILLLKSK